MKVDRKVREAFELQRRLSDAVKSEVDTLLKGAMDPGWHYESRIKELDSYALKIEAGRFGDQLFIDDFFAYALVVRNAREIASGIKLASSLFEIKARRPADPKKTEQRPTDFSFDDLRLYATLRPRPDLIKKEWDELVFEIQVKTFLQHAWAVATHDLTYKSDVVDWGRARIAHEVRAMLEHAELSIDQVDRLAGSALVGKEYEEYQRITLLISILKKYWSEADLPKDLQRLGRTAERVIGILELSVRQLDEALSEEQAAGRGPSISNLSPYGVIIQTIFNKYRQKVKAIRRGVKGRITVSSQVELPKELEGLDNKIFVAI